MKLRILKEILSNPEPKEIEKRTLSIAKSSRNIAITSLITTTIGIGLIVWQIYFSPDKYQFKDLLDKQSVLLTKDSTLVEIYSQEQKRANKNAEILFSDNINSLNRASHELNNFMVRFADILNEKRMPTIEERHYIFGYLPDKIESNFKHNPALIDADTLYFNMTGYINVMNDFLGRDAPNATIQVGIGGTPMRKGTFAEKENFMNRDFMMTFKAVYATNLDIMEYSNSRLKFKNSIIIGRKSKFLIP